MAGVGDSVWLQPALRKSTCKDLTVQLLFSTGQSLEPNNPGALPRRHGHVLLHHQRDVMDLHAQARHGVRLR